MIWDIGNLELNSKINDFAAATNKTIHRNGYKVSNYNIQILVVELERSRKKCNKLHIDSRIPLFSIA